MQNHDQKLPSSMHMETQNNGYLKLVKYICAFGVNGSHDSRSENFLCEVGVSHRHPQLQIVAQGMSIDSLCQLSGLSAALPVVQVQKMIVNTVAGCTPWGETCRRLGSCG
jgi:hypothetical protein